MRFLWLQGHKSWLWASWSAEPPTGFTLRDCCRSLCAGMGCHISRKEPRSTYSLLFNVVIDVNHILVVAESLDEMSSLFQVGLGQLHL